MYARKQRLQLCVLCGIDLKVQPAKEHLFNKKNEGDLKEKKRKNSGKDLGMVGQHWAVCTIKAVKSVKRKQ
jgi:hypothetical protein